MLHKPTARCVLVWLALVLAILLAATGCSEKRATQAKMPPPPTIEVTTTITHANPSPPIVLAPQQSHPKVEAWTQTGIASWYVADPHGQKTASGEPYNAMALTAAHRTLPLHSLVRVTNLKTNSQVTVRINDRGPFIEGRVIDLSLTAAKALDMIGQGLANVKLEVLRAPAAVDRGGKWCIQIGTFRQRNEALELKKSLADHYRDARLQDFAGATGYWVRLRVRDDDRVLAQRIADDIKAGEGDVFLVRID